MNRLTKKMMKIRESRGENLKDPAINDLSMNNCVGSTEEWLEKNEAYLPDGKDQQYPPAEPSYEVCSVYEELCSRASDPKVEMPSLYSNISRGMFSRTHCEVINPNLAVGSQRVKAIKRLAAQRKRQRKFKRKGSSQRYPALNVNSFISQSPLDISSTADLESLKRKVEELKKTIRLMEVSARQKDKEKALILEVRDSKKKQLEDLQSRIALQNDFPEDTNNNSSPMIITSAMSKDVPKSAQGSTRKRGRPPLDPCYPCPSKVKPSRLIPMAEDEGSSDGVFSDN